MVTVVVVIVVATVVTVVVVVVESLVASLNSGNRCYTNSRVHKQHLLHPE
jgi:type II secretory pathway component PulK